MADCGAAGATIDWAARAVLGNGSQEASKHVGALLGHATLASSGSAMPMAAPDQLTMPTTQIPAMNLGAPRMEAAWNMPAAAAMGPVHAHPSMALQHHQHHAMPPPPHVMMQEHQARFAMMQQQQQMMIQQQQMQQMMAAQQRQMQQQNKGSTTKHPVANTLSRDSLEAWHEGLEDEAQGILEADVENVGHEGAVQGASIEELAAAWAQAEAEYEELAGQNDTLDEEDYSNLWSGVNTNEPRPYEFFNKMEEQTEGQRRASPESLNWMEEGIKFFNDGNLKAAIRAFEMELQQNNPDNATAWRMLGRCHAENDMDPEAIKCLESAVDRDPFSPESLLALGVSYVNELNHEKALENMKAWFTHNPKYAGMEMPDDIYGATSTAPKESAFEEVKRLLLSALDFDSTDAADVHEALGVIYNVIKDYDAAAESFRMALQLRPEDYQLWNKLGATLANGSQSDQALPAYHRALQIKPKYARAWLNMAISHSNLQDHGEAARCYLQTLSLNPAATHCWTYLRMALSCAERWDLLPSVFSQDLSAFHEHFDFVQY